jgi:hypothetical protein
MQLPPSPKHRINYKLGSLYAVITALLLRLIPLTQGQLYVVCLKPGALKATPIRSGER